MFITKRGIGSAICLLMLSVELCFSAQLSSPVRRFKDLGAEQLENVQIDAQGITSFFAELSLTYDIPIGLETAANEYALTRYSSNFKKGTLADLLTQFVSRHSLYTWKIEDGVVNVFPKDGYRDLASMELLATKIERFSVKGNTSCFNLVESLVMQPEAKTILDANKTTYSNNAPSGFYIPNVGRSFTLEVSDVTVKSILNKVVSKSSTAKFWVITRKPDKTLLIDLTARHEDALRIKGTRRLQELFLDESPRQ